jgi:transposase
MSRVEGKSNVSQDVFVEAHETSANNREVAEKTGLSVESVQTRASIYRKKGIPLKKFPRGGGGTKLDVSGACELLARLRGETVEA